MYLAVGILAGVIIGVIITSTILRKAVEKKSEKFLQEAKEKAEVYKKDKILQAKEKFFQLKTDHEKAINEKNSQIQQIENRLKQKEASFSQKTEDLQRKQKEVDSIRANLSNQLEIVGKKQEDLDRSYKQQVEQLEAISGMSAQEAKSQLSETILEEAKAEAQVYITEVVMRLNSPPTKKPRKSLLSRYSVQLLSMQLKTPFLYSIWIMMRLRGALSAVKVVIFAPWNPLPVLRSSLMIHRKPSSFQVLIRLEERSHALHCTSSSLMAGSTLPALRR
jgi:hypothetical protein